MSLLIALRPALRVYTNNLSPHINATADTLNKYFFNLTLRRTKQEFQLRRLINFCDLAC